jgi:hypothetical protein
MRKTVRGRGNGNDRTQNDSRESKWALRGGWNERLCGEEGMGMAEHGMAAYPLLS